MESWTAHDEVVRTAGFWTVAKKMPKVYGRLLRECFQVAPASTVTIIGGILGAEISTAVGLLSTTDVLSSLLTAGPTPDRVRAAAPGLALMLIALVVRAGLREIVEWQRSRLVPRLRLAVRTRLLTLTTEIELVAFDDRRFRDVLHRVNERSADAVTGLLFSGLETASGVVGLLTVGGVLTVLHPVLLPLMIVAVVPTWFASVLAARVVYNVYAETSGSQRRMDTLAELMSGRRAAAEIRAFAMGSYLLAQFGGLARYVRDKQLESENTQARSRAFGMVLSGAGVGLVYTVLLILLNVGAMPLAVAGTAAVAIRTALSAMTGFSASTNVAYENALFYQDYLDFVREAEHRRERSGTSILYSNAVGVTLRNVSFTYPSAAMPALRGIDLDIAPGQVIAVVGGNGAGKSTLARVIAGLYRPESGQVWYSGVPIEDVHRRWLRDRIAVVAQDFTRWPFSARDNITVGRVPTSAPDAGFRQACTASGVQEVLARLPDGPDTMLDPSYVGGTDLSGGQWQRLAIARGLYSNPGLLIVDEPTAALDAPAERMIFDMIRAQAGGRTVVLITHRLSGVSLADQIVVLDGGRMVDRGTHTELMQRGGLYRHYYRLQAEPYEHQKEDAETEQIRRVAPSSLTCPTAPGTGRPSPVS
ncbi:ABC transporter ATP-binding protein [Rhodococcus rhodnii]|uniref:ABC transporter ATP-binding protein n=1 Tax=Rhodococcus rhodnii TaxID=38312 RepID=UPI000932ECCA|nr:ABC transporter ATP-binding protein [Rhodococcus rhodnii]